MAIANLQYFIIHGLKRRGNSDRFSTLSANNRTLDSDALCDFYFYYHGEHKGMHGEHKVVSLNPKYALENLFRTETTAKQIVTLTYLNSP